MPNDRESKRVVKPLYIGNRDDVEAAFPRFREAIAQESKRAERPHDMARLQESAWRGMQLDLMEAAYSKRFETRVFVSFTNTGVPQLLDVRSVAPSLGLKVDTYREIDSSDAAELKRLLAEREQKELGEKASNIHSQIINKIRNADAFLGIWSENFTATETAAEDVQGRPREATRGKVPGAWMPFELGIAFSLHKPWCILMQRGMHTGYSDRLLGSEQAFFFDPGDPPATRHQVESCLKRLRHLISERKSKATG